MSRRMSSLLEFDWHLWQVIIGHLSGLDHEVATRMRAVCWGCRRCISACAGFEMVGWDEKGFARHCGCAVRIVARKEADVDAVGRGLDETNIENLCKLKDVTVVAPKIPLLMVYRIYMYTSLRKLCLHGLVNSTADFYWASFQFVEDFSWEHGGIRDAEAEQICCFLLLSSPRLRRLSFANNEIGDMKRVLDTSRFSSLEELDFSGNKMTWPRVLDFTQGLSRFRRLKVLKLSHCAKLWSLWNAEKEQFAEELLADLGKHNVALENAGASLLFQAARY